MSWPTGVLVHLAGISGTQSWSFPLDKDAVAFPEQASIEAKPHCTPPPSQPEKDAGLAMGLVMTVGEEVSGG